MKDLGLFWSKKMKIVQLIVGAMALSLAALGQVPSNGSMVTLGGVIQDNSTGRTYKVVLQELVAATPAQAPVSAPVQVTTVPPPAQAVVYQPVYQQPAAAQNPIAQYGGRVLKAGAVGGTQGAVLGAITGRNVGREALGMAGGNAAGTVAGDFINAVFTR
jgi:hypothetical protein